MQNSIPSPQNTAVQQPTSVTVVQTEPKKSEEVESVTLRLRKPASDKKVQWSTGTVDNEHLNKKKSKCCCIFTKPRSLEDNSEDSSTDSDDGECEHCKGHIKKRKKCNDSHDQENVQEEAADTQECSHSENKNQVPTANIGNE